MSVLLLGTVASAIVVALAAAVPDGGPADLRDAHGRAVAPQGMAAEAGVPYPEGFRAWRHVKSELTDVGHPMYAMVGGLHHIYANDLAMAGYQGGAFADGAIIVFDLFEVTTDQTARLTTERARKSLWVMHKDAQRYAATGGWGFELFKGDSRTDRTIGANPPKGCNSCHAKAPGGVFSKYRS